MGTGGRVKAGKDRTGTEGTTPLTRRNSESRGRSTQTGTAIDPLLKRVSQVRILPGAQQNACSEALPSDGWKGLCEGLMRASLKHRHQGYHGQLILSSSDLEKMGELAAGDAADAVDAELRGGA